MGTMIKPFAKITPSLVDPSGYDIPAVTHLARTDYKTVQEHTE